MGIRHMSIEAEHGLNFIPNSPLVRETYGLDDRVDADRARQADRRRRDPVRRGLGLRDLRRVRRGLPGAHRARRQDRRPAPQPRPRGEPLPAGADRRVPEHGAGRQPVGPAALRPARLDARPAVRGPDRGRHGRRRSPRRARGPLLGRLRGRLRRAQPAGRARVRDVPGRGRGPVRGPRPGGVVHRRPGPPDGQRVRLPDAGDRQRGDAEPLRDGRADDRDGLPALLQHDRQRVRPVRRPVPDPAPQRVPVRAAGVRAPADVGGGRLDPLGHLPRQLLPHPLQRRRHLAARRARRGARPRAPGDGAQRPQHVLLRRRRRPDVDGGDARHADQRRADPSGARRPGPTRSPRAARSA